MPIEVLLLLALPASGKSELRRYMATLDQKTALRDLGLGSTVQLDDYPYVHMMRRMSQEIRAAGHDPVFFAADDQPFLEPGDWGTLIHLINLDYADLTQPPATPSPGEAARWLLDRIDRARELTGLPPAAGSLNPDDRRRLEQALEEEARGVFESKAAVDGQSLDDKTVIIEFARGGPEGSSLPLPAPYGYRHSLSLLSEEILESARILYVWVEPEESRRKNIERATPGPDGDASILHHGVPESVMRREYGTDDLMWLLAAGGGSYVVVERDGRQFALPTGVFDNRKDLTSFLRDDPEDWSPFEVRRLHRELVNATAGFRT